MNQSLPPLTPLRDIAALDGGAVPCPLAALFPSRRSRRRATPNLSRTGYLLGRSVFILKAGWCWPTLHGRLSPARLPHRELWSLPGCGSPGYPLLPMDPAAAGWLGALQGPPRDWLYAGPCSKMWEQGNASVACHPHPGPRLPSSLLLLQVATDHGLTWNFAAWSLSVEWISLSAASAAHSARRHLQPLEQPRPLLAPDGAGLYRAQPRYPGCHQRSAGHRARVSEFVLGLWLLLQVSKAARQWPMMQQDLPLLLRLFAPLRTDAVHHDAAVDPAADQRLRLADLDCRLPGRSPEPAAAPPGQPLHQLAGDPLLLHLPAPRPGVASPAASLSTLWRRGSPRGWYAPRPTSLLGCWPLLLMLAVLIGPRR